MIVIGSLTPLASFLLVVNIIGYACIAYLLIKRAKKRKHDSHKAE